MSSLPSAQLRTGAGTHTARSIEKTQWLTLCVNQLALQAAEAKPSNGVPFIRPRRMGPCERSQGRP